MRGWGPHLLAGCSWSRRGLRNQVRNNGRKAQRSQAQVPESGPKRQLRWPAWPAWCVLDLLRAMSSHSGPIIDPVELGGNGPLDASQRVSHDVWADEPITGRCLDLPGRALTRVCHRLPPPARIPLLSGCFGYWTSSEGRPGAEPPNNKGQRKASEATRRGVAQLHNGRQLCWVPIRTVGWHLRLLPRPVATLPCLHSTPDCGMSHLQIPSLAIPPILQLTLQVGKTPAVHSEALHL